MEKRTIEYCGYNKFVKGINLLVKKIQKEKYNTIYGIPRGGLLIAVFLSHKLNIPLITSKDDINSRTLIVDDICDNGTTLKDIKSNNSKCDTATLYIIKKNIQPPEAYFTSFAKVGEPTYYVYTRKKDWVIFPWEEQNG